MLKRTCSASRLTSSSTSPPCGENLTAFWRTLVMACRSLRASPTISPPPAVRTRHGLDCLALLLGERAHPLAAQQRQVPGDGREGGREIVHEIPHECGAARVSARRLARYPFAIELIRHGTTLDTF